MAENANDETMIPKVITREIPSHLILEPRLKPRLADISSDGAGLAASIKRQGLISPLVVIQENDKYRLLAGNRRLYALRSLNRRTAECRVVQIDPTLWDEITLVENLQRKDLSALEEGYAFAIYLQKTGDSHTELADRIGKERTYVTRRLMVLDLDDNTLAALEENIINLSQALLLRRVDDAETRARFIEHTQTYGANVRVMAYWVTKWEEAQAAQKASGEKGTRATDYTPPREIYMACDRCDEPTSYSQLKALYVCPKCHKLIHTFRLTKEATK